MVSSKLNLPPADVARSWSWSSKLKWRTTSDVAPVMALSTVASALVAPERLPGSSDDAMEPSRDARPMALKFLQRVRSPHDTRGSWHVVLAHRYRERRAAVF